MQRDNKQVILKKKKLGNSNLNTSKYRIIETFLKVDARGIHFLVQTNPPKKGWGETGEKTVQCK